MNRAQRGLAAILLASMLSGTAGLAWSQEEEVASSFVSLSYAAPCDSQNNRLVLSNSHTYKSVQVRVRWRAAGGKDLEDQFFPAPSTKMEIGCAADAEIVEAKFADF